MTERRGSLLVDALLAVVIFGAVVAAFSSGIFQGQQGTIRGGNRIRAAYLAQEALEAVRVVRDATTNGFTTNIAGRSFSDDYGVALSSGNWTIVDGSTTVDGIYTRTVRFAAGESGPTGPERKVYATVTWPEAGSATPGSITVSSYLSDWRTPPPPPWNNPVVRGKVLYTTITEPSLGLTQLEDVTLMDVEVAGGYAYAADAGGTYGLVIYNVSSVTSPSFVSLVSIPGIVYDIAISGNYAYLATSDIANELRIVDISNPFSVTCSPCAGQVDLSGNATARGVSVNGSSLYIVREQSAGPELFVYDISTPTAPALLSQVDSPPLYPRNMYAVAAGPAPYAYMATNYTTQELTVASTAANPGSITGGGDAPNISNPQMGRSVARLGNGVFLGVGGDNLCELFAFDISSNPQDPNAAPACGGNQAYDTGAPTDASESVNDIEVSASLAYGFIATDTQRATGNHYFHVLNFSNPTDITSAGKKIYDGNITTGYEADNGIFYREGDHTVFLVGGEALNPGSDLLILQGSYD